MTTFYGVGVGPGDPELITRKAVEVLQDVDRVAAPAAESAERSLALETARPFIPETTPTSLYFFPLTNDREAVESFWRNTARDLETAVNEGEKVAFLTLGDPALYSTCTNLLDHVSDDLEVELVPGVSSISAAAARIGRPLARRGELFSVITGNQIDQLNPLLSSHDAVAILKPQRVFNRIRNVVTEQSNVEQTLLVSRCGMENERVLSLRDADPEDAEYMSLVLVFTSSNHSPDNVNS